MAGVEARVVLHGLDRRLDGVERRAAATEDRPSSPEGVAHGVAIRRLVVGIAAGAAVGDQRGDHRARPRSSDARESIMASLSRRDASGTSRRGSWPAGAARGCALPRGGGRRAAASVPRRDLLGPPGAELRRRRRHGCCWSAWRRPRTAGTAPAACSPATQRAGAASGSRGPSTPTASRPSRRRATAATGSARRRLHHGGGPLRAARQPADAPPSSAGARVPAAELPLLRRVRVVLGLADRVRRLPRRGGTGHVPRPRPVRPRRRPSRCRRA